MHSLLQGIQSEQALRQPHGLVEVTRLPLQFDERLHGLAVDLSQVAPLRFQPGLELRFLEVYTLEQIAPIETGRRFQVLRRAARGELEKLVNVNFERFRLESDRSPVA